MSSSQQDIVSLDGSNFDASVIIGVVLITLIVIVVVSIIMNIWMKYKSIQVMSSVRYIKNKSVSPATASLKMLTKPPPALNKETTLPVYHKTDTWESYLRMIQTPDKLNDVVYSMKVGHTPSSSISTKVGYSPDIIDNTYEVGHSPSGSIDNTYKVGHSPSGSIDNTYKVGHSPSGSIDNTCYTFNDYKLYRQSPLPKEYDDNN